MALISNKMSSLITTNNLLYRQINQQRLDILFFGSPYKETPEFSINSKIERKLFPFSELFLFL